MLKRSVLERPVVNAQENTKKKASNNTDCIVPDLIDLFGDY